MIEMIAGVFGLRVESGKTADGKPKYRVKGMGPDDGPFAASKEQEARLVKLGLARYVDPPKVDADADGGAGEYPTYNADMKVDQLKEIGKQFGLTFKVGMKKTDMVAALDKLFGKVTDDDTDADGGVDGDTDGTEDDDDTPTFDPAGAVL